MCRHSTRGGLSESAGPHGEAHDVGADGRRARGQSACRVTLDAARGFRLGSLLRAPEDIVLQRRQNPARPGALTYFFLQLTSNFSFNGTLELNLLLYSATKPYICETNDKFDLLSCELSIYYYLYTIY